MAISLLRHLAFVPNPAVYGIPYAFVRWLVRSPRPLDPEWTWHMVARTPPPALAFVADHWPLRPLRAPLLWAKMQQDHVLGISEHYDVSNDFYELFLDPKYLFYLCADFHRPDETLREAQQHKADRIFNLINPRGKRFWSSDAAGGRCSVASMKRRGTRRTFTA